MQNIYTRLIVYPFTLLIGVLPAWAMGWITLTPANALQVNFAAVALAVVIGVLGSSAVFAKWGIKPHDLFNIIPAATYGRLFLYATSFLTGLLPANLAGAVTVDVARFVVTFDLPTLGYTLGSMVAAGIGLNLSVLGMFGIKR